MIRFDVTYEIWNDEAAEAGETDDRGYIDQGLRLRDAIDCVLATRTSRVDGGGVVEPSDSTIRNARWFTVENGMEYETGEYEYRSLHIPANVTPSSRIRIATLLGLDG